jgi:hypothetical protein
MKKLQIDAFLRGLFAELSSQGFASLSVRSEKADAAAAAVSRWVRDSGQEYGLRSTFRIVQEPLGEALLFREALRRLAISDTISFDNPEYQDVRFRRQASRVRDESELQQEFFREAGRVFLNEYLGTKTSA